MTTVLIADDEPHLARALQTDIAFLDIQMPGLTGLEVAQGIEGATRVVFVTAFDEYAVQAFDEEAVDYVLKPVKLERLQRTMERVQRALAPAGNATSTLDANDPNLLAVLKKLMPTAAPQAATPQEHLRWVRASRGDITHQVAVQDVLFFHADEKYTCVQTAQAEYLIRTPIADLAAQLDPAQYWQVHICPR